MALIVHVVDGEIRLIIEDIDTTSSVLTRKFPTGDLYVRFQEPQGMQWRVLQHEAQVSDVFSYYAALLPISIEQLPEIVQVVHTCTN
jgi:hypothetical protein